MNEDEIRKMEAGRKMDALVARRVFDATEWCPDDPDDIVCQCERTPPHTIHCRDPLPEFSTDIAAAWEVEEKLWNDAGMLVTLKRMGDYQQWEWFALFSHETDGNTWFSEAVSGYHSAPLAICRAALLAVMEAES